MWEEDENHNLMIKQGNGKDLPFVIRGKMFTRQAIRVTMIS